MTAAFLFVYALGLGLLAPWVMRRGSWPDRSPRLALAVWFSAVVSAVAATIAAALSMVASNARVGDGLSALVNACAAAVRAHVSGVAQPLGPVAGTLVLVGVAVACGHGIRMAFVQPARRRRWHADAVTVIGRRDAGLGAMVVDHAQPAAYCVPGRRGLVVVTRGAVDRLDPAQLRAVLAHERAHLKGRHHLLLAVVGTVARAFPRVPLFGAAASAVAHLLEVLADDAAARRSGRLTVASALANVAAGAAPDGTLAAGGHDAVARVRRLVRHPAPLGAGGRLAVGAVVTVLSAAPVVLLANPLLLSLIDRHCTWLW